MSAAAAALLAVVALGAPRAAPVPCEEVELRRAKPMMATIVSVTARGCAGADLEAPVQAAFAEMARLAAMLSEWEPASAVSAVNAAAGVAPVRVPPELFHLLEAARRTAARTSGAFDPTWAALADLWRFDGAPPRLPRPEEVASHRALVGWRHLLLDPVRGTAYLDRRGMRLGLGGIAKGYIAEAAADALVARGVRNLLVAASGDVAARGRRGGRPWSVAVRDPHDPSGRRAVVELSDESISTSGDYERFFVVGGRRYHHILDPRTGWPASGTASVTVVARHGADADALATGLFVLGTERGARATDAEAGEAVLFVAADGSARAFGPPARFRGVSP